MNLPAIEREAQRVSKLAREYLADVESKLPDDADPETLIIDHWIIVPVLAWEDEDGERAEFVGFYGESSKPHVRLGAIAALYTYLRSHWHVN